MDNKNNKLIVIRKRCKKRKAQIESAKEIFITIFLPVQLALWAALNESGPKKFAPITMLVFCLIFANLISGMNRTIFKIEQDIEEINEKLKEN